MAQGETKNIGQVAAIWISAGAPTNTKLVWYDTSNNVHRVYNTSTGQWEVLNPQAVTNISLDSLATVATTSGLPIGKFYYLTDVGSLAISITTTKVWYADTHNNYVINDLAGAIQHYLNSDNLTIDGKTGVWDSATGKLTFSFNEILYPGQLDKEHDSVLLHHGTGSFLKAKLKHLISTATGNSITWSNGLFFNASSFISSIRNVSGGIVGFDRYQIDMSSVNTALNNLATDNNTVRNDCKTYTDNKVTNAQIYGKKLPSPITPSLSPANTPTLGWTFLQIISDIYGWFSRLKYGNNINISTNFNANGQSGEINQSDTVATAFQKTVYKLKRLAISDNVSLPSDFDGEDSVTYTGYPVANNTLTQAVGKLTVKIRELFARPYVNESEWHTENDMKWIIRNNNLFIEVQLGADNYTSVDIVSHPYPSYKYIVQIQSSRSGATVQTLTFGSAFMAYIAAGYFKSILDEAYHYEANWGSTYIEQWFIPLELFSDAEEWMVLHNHSNLYGTVGLCIQKTADNYFMNNSTWSAFIGFQCVIGLDSEHIQYGNPPIRLQPRVWSVPLPF